MKNGVLRVGEPVSAALLALSAAAIPLSAGAVSFPWGEKVFLILAMLFVAVYGLTLVLSKQLGRRLAQFWALTQFAAVLAALATVRGAILLSDGAQTTFFSVYKIPILLIYSLFTAMWCAPRRRGTLDLALVFGTVVSLLTLIYSWHFNLDYGVYRFLGAYSNPNICGLFGCLSCMLSLYALACGHTPKILSIVNFSVGYAAVMLSYSRTCLGGLLVGVAAFSVYSLVRRRKELTKQRVYSLLKTVIAVVLLCLVFWSVMKPDGADRDSAEIVGTGYRPGETVADHADDDAAVADRFDFSSDKTDSILHNLRFRIWRAYIEKAGDYFLIGERDFDAARPIVEQMVRDPHNTYLYVFYRYGAVALVSFLVLLASALVRLLRGRGAAGAYAGAFGLLFAVAALCMFNDQLNTPAVPFAAALVCAGAFGDFARRDGCRRVLNVFSTLNKGGAESRTMDVYRSLDRERMQFDFLATTPGVEENYFYGEIRGLGGRVLHVPPIRTIDPLRYIRQWRRCLTQYPYDAVHVHCSTQSGFAIFFAWLNRVPLRIVHYRDSGTGEFEGASRGRRAFLQLSRILSLCLSNRRIYCSDQARRYAAGPFASLFGNFIFLPNAIDLSKYPLLSEGERSEKKKALGLAGAEYVIGTVGNSRPVKNHLFLVRAFEAFLRLSPNSRLIIVGNDSRDGDAKEYAAQAGISDKVAFLGVRSDVGELLQTMDLFVLPSLAEGAPGSVIEAQAVNLPCILSDTITRDVDVGSGLLKYLPLGDPPEAWAEQMLAGCRMARPQPQSTREKLIRAGYDVAASARRLIDLYE